MVGFAAFLFFIPVHHGHKSLAIFILIILNVAVISFQWERHFYETLRSHGLSQDKCGASSHGLRHAYAQARYEQITGFSLRCKFESSESFRANAERTADEDWSKADQDARQIIKAELGHGPDRDDVMAQYLGAKC